MSKGVTLYSYSNLKKGASAGVWRRLTLTVEREVFVP
jgi:hypothetical protein